MVLCNWFSTDDFAVHHVSGETPRHLHHSPRSLLLLFKLLSQILEGENLNDFAVNETDTNLFVQNVHPSFF
jgi:hypothetical protein